MTNLNAALTTTQRISEMNFCVWLGQADTGDVLAYHRGFLALDTSSCSLMRAETDRKELVRLARRAWWAAQRGLVHLVQRRNGPDDFTYLAIARPKPKQASVSFSSLLLDEAA